MRSVAWAVRWDASMRYADGQNIQSMYRIFLFLTLILPDFLLGLSTEMNDLKSYDERVIDSVSFFN